MKVKQYDTIKDYFQENLSFLEEAEAINNLLIGIPLSMTSEQENNSPPNLISVIDDLGQVIFSLVQTPPKNYLIYGKTESLPAALELLIPFLRNKNIIASGIIGPKNLCTSFAEAWEKHTHQKWKVNFKQLIYQLDVLKEVRKTNGHLRKATLDDLPILSEWFFNFSKEAMNNTPDKFEIAEMAKAKINTGMLYLWEDQKVVSMAAAARPTRNGITVNYVYTPPKHRGHGYASNCVAGMSKLLLEKHKYCCLFTDATFPTSNKIYSDMGYYLIEEFREIFFL